MSLCMPTFDVLDYESTIYRHPRHQSIESRSICKCFIIEYHFSCGCMQGERDGRMNEWM